MFRIFWTDIDEYGNNLIGHCDYWDVENMRAWFRTKPASVKVYRAQRIIVTKKDIIRRQLIGAA